MAISKVPQSAQKQLETLIHVFAAGDGGVSLCHFKANYEAIERDALAGDENSITIMAKVQGVINLVQHLAGIDNDNLQY
ncbi:hypothetical protein KNV09_gp189 [Vibrio phage Athena]|uniref:Uncharacterized protein n=8 Tax=Thalassavirus TaxID=2948922 RepID=A0A6M4EUZ2_9CAUD|nr:hypothetical protein KNU52_gp179 [Vibrio phage Achelous]YP_010102528.1 hypothetical protein KNU58_gp177 [Vibrio phage Brizo]YP_010105689.1 hypothetical protein KNU87_gp190 [Vibrio phage Bennett]YP_010105884.1 hypothetical protein KNU88_gp188 [Vibrio phage Chester]YP_010108333.1 hypothetical protein KNV07_gp189 [Vibrio phage Cody]YP_010108527.1 hypothetical protein KNV08_gp193 [Vibrio phage Quinn]YP_010108721.1 hypothetical protein KNV09_gp189 [Vibrio phage Athena]YP_010114271.1 hypothetic